MKGFIDSLADLGLDITDRVLILNILRRLNKNFEHLRAIFTHVTPFPSFQKVLDDLCLEEIQQGTWGMQTATPAPPPSAPRRSPIVFLLRRWARTPARTATASTTPLIATTLW
jgi:hypothetical protein